ncbi:MAG: helix-turn-helix domain-containing protein, partial [Candidatus Poribacteria bacterium]|nr:helix-turn-helix domain-containing protein [Candidatus Poribacteria bacterium]
SKLKDDPEYMTLELCEDIANQINSMIRREGISEEELAKRIGRSMKFVDEMLYGKPNLTLTTLVQVALALGWHVDVAFDKRETHRERAYQRDQKWRADFSEPTEERLASD